MANVIKFLCLIALFVRGGQVLQYHDDGDHLWTFLKELVDGGEMKEDSYDEDDNDDDMVKTVKENDKVYDVIRNDMAEASKPLEDVYDVSILMPKVSPKKMDTYLCRGYKLPKERVFITAYQPSAKMNIAHHMLMFGCKNLPSKETYWNCGQMGSPCGAGHQSIVYAWGRDAPPLTMDKDVGMKVGGDTGFDYLVLQVHYLHVKMFKDPKKSDSSGVTVTFDKREKSKLAGIYFLGAGWPPIPPHKKEFSLPMGCKYGKNGVTFHPFRFRVHAHSLGRVISAYRVRNDVWTLIGRRDPLLPQAFYPVANEMDIKPGDELMGRCTYDSTSRNRTTVIGATHTDEMCNFYIMYYYDSKQDGSPDDGGCLMPEFKYFEQYPTDHVV